MDASAPEMVRVRVEDAVLECEEGRLDHCVGETRYFFANCSDEPVTVRGMSLGEPGGRRSTIYDFANDPLAPHTVWSWKTRVHYEDSLQLRVDVVDSHDVPIFIAELPVRTSNPAREAAMKACEACGGTWGIQGLLYRDACNCRARDAGHECHDGDACEGVCKFDHWAISQPAQPARCTGKGKQRTCTARVLAVGRPVGHCSAQVAVRSCHNLLKRGITSEPEQSLPWGTTHMCID